MELCRGGTAPDFTVTTWLISFECIFTERRWAADLLSLTKSRSESVEANNAYGLPEPSFHAI